jgi:hypothetical protein
MAPRTGGDPLVGEDKIPANSSDFALLVQMAKQGQLKEITPSSFYETNENFHQKYTFKALQNVWGNAKKQAAKEITGAFAFVCLFVLIFFNEHFTTHFPTAPAVVSQIKRQL